MIVAVTTVIYATLTYFLIAATRRWAPSSSLSSASWADRTASSSTPGPKLKASSNESWRFDSRLPSAPPRLPRLDQQLLNAMLIALSTPTAGLALSC